MENTHGAIGEISNGSRVGKRGREEGTRYTRFTEEQSQALERVFAVCPFPDQIQLTRILVTEPILSGVTIKQLRVWFQNRRSRDRQRRGNEELVEENKRLVAGNNTLKQNNNGLQRQADQITMENESLRNRILSSRIAASDVSRESVFIVSQRCSTISDDIKSLHSLAEEIKNEFITKAIGTAINWNPVPVLTKLHGSGSPCEIYISSACVGVAVRACTALPFEPMKVINILKDRLSWSRDCRGMNVVAKYRATSAGVVEIIYTQYYAPTSMAFARDFWTMRYSSILDDGSFLVCERSISGSNNVPSLPATCEFVRCKMLASGYLVRSCDGGSTITIVDHLDLDFLQALSVPELVRPLYNSPEIVAKRMTLSALHCVRQLADKTDGEAALTGHSLHTNLRSLSKRLCRGFNDAVSGLTEDGWKRMHTDASKEFIISLKQTNAFGANATDDGIICVKTSLLLHNVLPASLVKLLKEHRSAWMNFNFANNSAAFSKAARRAYPSSDTHNLSGEAVTLCSTGLEDEAFEVIRFDRYFERRPEISSGDICFMQISSGMEDSGIGACSELILAPFERFMADDAVLLCSGFRIFLLGTNTNESQHPSLCTSLLILAFQFPSGTTRIQEQIATTARKYVRHVISSVKKLCRDALPSESNPEKMSHAEENPASLIEAVPEANLAADLAVLITESFRSMLGVEMLGLNLQTADSVAQLVQNHQYAILCFSFSSVPVIFYANEAALDMLGTTTDKLQHIPVDKVLGGSGNVSLDSILPTIMQQGFTILPSGCYISETNNCVTYDEAILWQVRLFDGSIHCLAAAFTDCLPFM